jgi:RNA polymerase subunit RPABC4/transcription elongation factor Spt4
VTEVKEMRALCRTCAGPVALDFAACPNCGTHLNPACTHCSRILQPGWQFCPYCAHETAAVAAQALVPAPVASGVGR